MTKEVIEKRSPFIGKMVKNIAHPGADLVGVVVDGRRMVGRISENVTDVISVLFTNQSKEWMLVGTDSQISNPFYVFVDD